MKMAVIYHSVTGNTRNMDHCMVMGALTYSGGAAHGKPVIHLGPVGIDNTLDINEFSENFVIYGTRMAEKAKELFS